MSARSVAEHALTVYYEDSEDPAGMARKVLDAYAHELAERQRREVKHHEELGFLSDLTPSKLIAVIDPEVLNGG